MILRSCCLSIILLFSGGCIMAQSGWSKVFLPAEFRGVNFDDIQYHNDMLILRGNSYIRSDSIWGLLTCAIDTNGLLLWQQTIFDTTKSSHIVTNTPSRFAISNDKFIIPSYYFNHNEIVLFIADSVGHQIASQNYPHSNFTIFPIDVIVQEEHYYIFGYVQRTNYRIDVFVIRTDTLGIFEWIKYFGTTQYNEMFGDVLPIDDGTFTISAKWYTDDFSLEFDDENWCRPWIFTIDTAGNMLDQWWGEANDQRTLGGGPFYRMTDGSYILLSSDVIQAPSPYDNEWRVSPTITRLDSNYNLVWKKNFSDFRSQWDEFIDLEYDPRDNTFVATGYLDVWYSSHYRESEIWVLKFNEDGDILWNITDTIYYNMQELHYPAGLVIAPSGSIYVAGYVDKGRDEGWILKVTPDGCSDTICTITSISDQIDLDKNQVRVYPNPSKEIINVDVKNPGEQQRFIVYNLNGQVVLYQYIEAPSNGYQHGLPSGLYFYSVFDRTGLLKSGKFVVQ